MNRLSTRLFVPLLLLTLLTAFSVLAADPNPPDPAVGDTPKLMGIRPDKVNHALGGMLVDLPSQAVSANAEVTLAVKKGDRVLVSQTIALPDTIPAVPTVAFLADHHNELDQLRRLAETSPGTLRFTATVDKRVIVDVPFAEAGRGSDTLTDGDTVIGTNLAVTMNMRPPRSIAVNGLYPDPQCDQECGDTYYQCMNDCDQRGWCGYCAENYNACSNACPQLCEEPKQVYEYETDWEYWQSYYEPICLQYYYRFLLWRDYERRAVYQRTVHCDDTYTDVFVRYETRYAGMCKTFVGYGCVGDMHNPPGDC